MMKKLALAALVFTLGSVTALAADFNGKWTADVPGRNGNTQTVTFDFHVDGSTLTGKVTNQRGDMDISNGKVDGDTISFDTTMNFNGNSMTQSYKGMAQPDGTIKFTRAMSGGMGGGGNGGGNGGGGGMGGPRPPVEFTAKPATAAAPAAPPAQ
jgi:hypothetical protein